MENSPLPNSKSNSFRIDVVRTPEQMMHALAIRSLCFMEEYGLSAKQSFDGNDYQASHVIMYDGDEPVACSRIRWFRDFAKIERTAVRKAYRHTNAMRLLGNFLFEHIARKGYDTVTTNASPELSRLWRRMFGFQPHPSKPPLSIPGHGAHLDLIKYLQVPDDAIRLDDSVDVLLRVEGHWDTPSDFS